MKPKEYYDKVTRKGKLHCLIKTQLKEVIKMGFCMKQVTFT